LDENSSARAAFLEIAGKVAQRLAIVQAVP